MKSIITKNIKIPRTKGFDNEYIENRLMKSDFIRWAITDIDEKEITVTVSFYVI